MGSASVNVHRKRSRTEIMANKPLMREEPAEEVEWTTDGKPTALLYALLAKHVLTKGFQAGSFIGCAVVVPSMAAAALYRRGGIEMASFGPAAIKALAISSGVGFAASGR